VALFGSNTYYAARVGGGLLTGGRDSWQRWRIGSPSMRVLPFAAIKAHQRMRQGHVRCGGLTLLRRRKRPVGRYAGLECV